MSIYSKAVISPSASHPTFLIHIKKDPINNLEWKGFTEMSQIGQYFSLTISNEKGRDRVTRLYTNIWSMRHENIELMQQTFPGFRNNLTDQFSNEQKPQSSVII